MRYLILFLLVCISIPGYSQSNTTEKLHRKNNEALSLFFYNNTLRMLNQTADPDFDALIKDVEKMKFLMIDKSTFGAAEYKNLVNDYKKEDFEEIMTSRHQGKNVDVFLKEEKGKTKGMVVTVNDSSNLFVLDIVGSIALDKVTKLISTLDESADISNKIKMFTKKED